MVLRDIDTLQDKMEEMLLQACQTDTLLQPLPPTEELVKKAKYKKNYRFLLYTNGRILMDQPISYMVLYPLHVGHSCGSCGYSLKLISSKTSKMYVHKKPTSKDMIYLPTVDLCRFTQVGEFSCFPFSMGSYQSKIKLLCRKCGIHIGYGYGQPGVNGFHSDGITSTCRKYVVKARAIQPSDF